MKKIFPMKPFLQNQDGAVLVITMILIVLIIGFAALTFDVGYVASTKNELQNVADGAALAAAGELGNMYASLTYEEQQSFVCDPTDIINIARGVGLSNGTSNPSGSESVTIRSDDVMVGTWDPTVTVGDPFTPTLNQPDAVRVITRRDASANGPIATFFARIFNMNSVNITATATAALTGQGTANEGDMPFPVGIPRFRVEGNEGDWCGDYIKFSPPTDLESCAGWTDLESPPDASVTPNGIEDILDGSAQSSSITANESEVAFNNGKLSVGVFEAFMVRYYEDGFDIDAQDNPRLKDDDETPHLFSNTDNFDPSAQAPNGAGPAVAIYMDGCKKTCMGGSTSCPEMCDHGTQQARYPPCSGGSGSCSGDLRYDHVWRTSVVVYDSDTCSPNTAYKVLGFSEVEIFNVIGPSEKLAEGKIICGYIDPYASRGGGGSYGKKGSIPGLVE